MTGPKFKYIEEKDKDNPENNCNIIRFSSLYDLFYYDIEKNNPKGLGFSGTNIYEHLVIEKENYINKRWVLDDYKKNILDKAYKDLSKDESFLKLMHSQKTLKRKFINNKHKGSFNPVAYSREDEKMFIKGIPNKKKPSINIAIQVGVFSGSSYTVSFINILKLILSLQQLNISYNIDMFDSDTRAINNENSYVIVNVSNTLEKFDLKSILCCAYEQFFHFSLFNGYSASKKQKAIGTFLENDVILRDLSAYYDIIAGNLNETKYSAMMNKVNKIYHNDNKN